MGRIANKIDAKDKKLSEVLNNQRYRIDAYQREYRWQRKQIESLISDLSISFLKNYEDNHTIEDYDNYDCYYMGPIVLCDDKRSLAIVDGQQRLTSFTLLLIYLKHEQENHELSDELKKDLTPFLYVNKVGKKTLVLNVESRNKVIEYLFQNPNSFYKDFERMQNAEKEEDKENLNDESIRNLIERYQDITNLFPEEIKDKNKLPIFIEWLLEKVVLVEVKAYNSDGAYSIFETMNDRGLSLNPTEILKAYLLNQIDDELKSIEINAFWKERISDIKIQTGNTDGDLDFFRTWLRAKYAETKRGTKQGAENEDFELIGTQFHSWVKNNSNKLYLKHSDDFYFFIRSDFDFFCNIYLQIFLHKNVYVEEFEEIYITNFYPIADSLSYPLYLSSISKLDEADLIIEKISLVNKFLDVYANRRTIANKAITQSSIRGAMYELVKSIRNEGLDKLKIELKKELEKTNESSFPSLSILHEMNNFSYYHYFFARILYELNDSKKGLDFNDLMRSRKQKSYILCRIFKEEEMKEDFEKTSISMYVNSVAGYCLVRRNEVDAILELEPSKRVKELILRGYLPEMDGIEYSLISNFINVRDVKLQALVEQIWAFK
ncbi:MAG: hypothetical protein RJA07_461 [Bacteroidota bacterium]|jgi:uncharacterized protein with ParB-like and HNH nuclease domain